MAMNVYNKDRGMDTFYASCLAPAQDPKYISIWDAKTDGHNTIKLFALIVGYDNCIISYAKESKSFEVGGWLRLQLISFILSIICICSRRIW